MKKNANIHKDEVDIIGLLITIFQGKIKILLITTIFFLIGISYSKYTSSNNYLFSLSIKPTDASHLTKFSLIGKYLNYDISNTKVLEKFISELEDYDELLIVLGSNKIIKENISKVNYEDQENELFKYSNSFKIIYPEKNKTEYLLRFEWHDKEEGIDILKNTIYPTLRNLENSIYNDLESTLKFKKIVQKTENIERLDFLKLHSQIARDLGIKLPNVENMPSLNINQNNSQNNQLTDIYPLYYLKGYHTIDKEIEFVMNQSGQNFISIEQVLNSLKEDNIKWISYNENSIVVRKLNLDNKIIYLSFILLGLIVGVLYVLISSAFQSKVLLKKRK